MKGKKRERNREGGEENRENESPVHEVRIKKYNFFNFVIENIVKTSIIILYLQI